MKQLIDSLRRAGNIAHWTIVPASEHPGANLSCPPILAWRYEQPSDELADCLRRVVSSFRGTLSWEFSAAARMWTLMPSKIKEYAEAHGAMGGLAAAKRLMETEPEFGLRANAELPRLAEHIKTNLVKELPAPGIPNEST